MRSLPVLPLLLALGFMATGCSFIRTRPITRTESAEVVCSNSRIPAYVDMGIGLAMHAALLGTALAPDASDTTTMVAAFGQFLPLVLVLPSMIHGFAQAGRCSRALEAQWRTRPAPSVTEPLHEVPRVSLAASIPVPPGCDAAAIQRAGVAALRRSGLELARPRAPDPEPVSAWTERDPGRCGRIQFSVLGGSLGVRIQTEVEVPSPTKCPEQGRLFPREELWLYRLEENLVSQLEACRTTTPPAPSSAAPLPSDLPRELQLPAR